MYPKKLIMHWKVHFSQMYFKRHIMGTTCVPSGLTQLYHVISGTLRNVFVTVQCELKVQLLKSVNAAYLIKPSGDMRVESPGKKKKKVRTKFLSRLPNMVNSLQPCQQLCEAVINVGVDVDLQQVQCLPCTPSQFRVLAC